MENIKRLFELKNRLMCAAEFVRNGSRIADIGTDHAFLPIWLAKNNKISYGIASDIREGPYNSAVQNIKSYDVCNIVEARLGAGLTTVKENEADDVLICGMGGELIASILNDCNYIKNSKYHLILQPMSRPEALRKYLFENGFKIDTEKCVFDSNHYYTVISAYYSGENLALSDDSYFYIGKVLSYPNKITYEYLLIQHHRLQNIIKGCKINGNKSEFNYYTAIDKKILKAAEACR